MLLSVSITSGVFRMTKGSAVLLLEGSYSRYVAFRDKSGLVFDIQLRELIYDKDMENLKLGTPQKTYNHKHVRRN
jgi:hypothetical protein